MKVILLTGGESKRFGSDKSQALIAGKSLLSIIKSQLDPADVIEVGAQVKGGPVAAINSVIKKIESELVAVIATDMPFAPRVLPELKSKLINEAVLPIDEAGKVQPLAAIYRTIALGKALSKLVQIENASMHSLLKHLQIDEVKIKSPEFLIDIDTEADLLRAAEMQGRLSS